MIGPILSTLDPQPSTLQAGLPGSGAGNAAPTAQGLPGQALPGSGAVTLPGATGSALGS